MNLDNQILFFVEEKAKKDLLKVSKEYSILIYLGSQCNDHVQKAWKGIPLEPDLKDNRMHIEHYEDTSSLIISKKIFKRIWGI